MVVIIFDKYTKLKMTCLQYLDLQFSKETTCMCEKKYFFQKYKQGFIRVLEIMVNCQMQGTDQMREDGKVQYMNWVLRNKEYVAIWRREERAFQMQRLAGLKALNYDGQYSSNSSGVWCD